MHICCIITWKSRFSHGAPKSLIFDALIRRKVGFLMTRQKGANLLHYYMENRFSHDAPKTLIFDALILGKSAFLMTRHKGANLLHYNVS